MQKHHHPISLLEYFKTMLSIDSLFVIGITSSNIVGVSIVIFLL